jgi:hypothetical protein
MQAIVVPQPQASLLFEPRPLPVVDGMVRVGPNHLVPERYVTPGERDYLTRPLKWILVRDEPAPADIIDLRISIYAGEIAADSLIGTARVRGSVPIIAWRAADTNIGREVDFGEGWMHPIEGAACVPRYLDIIHSPRLKIDHDPRRRLDTDGNTTTDSHLELQSFDGPGWCRDVADQIPLDDFRPGRHAWLFADQEAVRST